MKAQGIFDFDGIEAEKMAFAAMNAFARNPAMQNRTFTLRFLARLPDERCSYVLSHYSEDAFDISLQAVTEFRGGTKA